MRTNYPESWAILKAKRARHPREDAIEEFTDWTLLGNPIEVGDGPKPVAADVLTITKEVAETEEQYIKRKTDFLRHKNIACRRGAGGKWFSNGGGGEGGCAFQVTP